MSKKEQVESIILTELENSLRSELMDDAAAKNNLENTDIVRNASSQKDFVFSYRSDINGTVDVRIDFCKQLSGKCMITIWNKSYPTTVTLSREEWIGLMSAANRVLNRLFEKYAEKIKRNAN